MALDLEAFDIKTALDFSAFVLEICTLYTIKKNEPLNRKPHLVSRIPLISSIGNEISGSECLKIGLHSSIVALKPLSVAGKFVFDVEGFANRILNK